MKNKAFTLIELLVVVLIIGILAAIALPMYEKAVEKSRISEAKIALNTMKRNYELCELEFGKNADECTAFDVFIPNHLAISLPGQYTDDCGNWSVQGQGCFLTKNWAYDTDDPSGFYASRALGNAAPYTLFIEYSSGNIKCLNYAADKDYCKNVCGGDYCILN